ISAGFSTVVTVLPVTHASDNHPRNERVTKVVVLSDFHRAENCSVNGAGTDHRKRSRGAEVARTRRGSNGFLAGVDEFRIQLLFGGVCAHAEDTVFGVQDNFLISGNEPRHLGWDANTKVDVLAVFKFGSYTRRHLIMCPSH